MIKRISCIFICSWPNAFCVVFAAYQPLRSQLVHPIISFLDFTRHFNLLSTFHPISHPFVTNRDTFLLYLVGRFSIESNLKGSITIWNGFSLIQLQLLLNKNMQLNTCTYKYKSDLVEEIMTILFSCRLY